MERSQHIIKLGGYHRIFCSSACQENANKHEDELSTLQEKIESLEKKIREKDKYLERLKRNSQVFEEEVSNAEKTLVLQLKKLNKRNTALEEEIKEIKGSKEKINAELESARDAKQVLEVKIKELTALNRDMVVTIETLEKDNQAYLKETKEIQLKLLSIQIVNNVEQQSYETDMDEVRKMSESMLTSIKVLESENQQYSCEINRLEDIIRKLKSANAKPENNSHIPYSKQVLRKEDKRKKILILCDEAGRGLNGLLEKKFKQDYCVQCIIKPGAPYVDVIHNMEQLVKDFTKSDCVIVLAGSNEFQQGMLARTPLMVQLLEGMKNELSNLRKEINELRNETGVKNSMIGTIQSKTFAEALKSRDERMNAQIKAQSPSLIIKPKQKQNSEKTKNDLKEKIQPNLLKIGIKNMRETKRGCVVVKCTEKNDIEKLKQAAENSLGGGYDIELPKLNSPRMKIVGYNGDLAQNELEHTIRQQNEWIEDGEELTINFIKKVTTFRVNTALRKFPGRASIGDQRGLKQGGKNKLTDDRVQAVVNHINKIPKYSSHYRREQTNAEYLPPGTTIQKMYDMYKEEEINPTAKEEIDHECLSFDLEKTLPLPRIPTGIVFYKRQLWVYNAGIHSGKENRGYCYVCVEGSAGRGAQEIGSCLIKHVKAKVPIGVKHLTLWCDSCGGQNRNIKLILMLKSILHGTETNLETVTIKYLCSGHSFLPNDTDFSDIESALKRQQRLYTPKEYIEVMRSCRRKTPLVVTQMQTEDFLGVMNVEKKITNRKITDDKEKINWLKIRAIKIDTAT
ncbi:unnamed protein product [Ceutorhynchus assimilis]|uniref:DUF7869 domain-containing protein n=1 Tax=Ceutorhynchus assimilis TaxID=467358 RepID=A0A9N9QJI2_9CUCU|nr:unnamed protein product [Ceutorhynchus assimilis]